MKRHQAGPGGVSRVGRRAAGAALAVALWAWALAAPSRAADQPRLEISYQSPEKTRPVGEDEELQLRPNVDQPVYLAVSWPKAGNRAGRARDKAQQVTVEIWANGKAVAEGVAKVVLAPGKTEGVKFGPPPPAEKGKPAPPPEFKPVKGPPFKFEIRLYRVKAGANPDKELLQTLPLRHIMAPAAYVGVTSQYDGTKQNLTVVATAQETFVGPNKCPVLLELPPELARGRNDESLSEQYLHKPGDQVELYNSRVKLRADADEEGYVNVSVDKFARAFVFRQNFAGRGNNTGSPVQDARVRLLGPAVVLPGRKLPFDLLVDYTPQRDGDPTPDEVILQFGVYRIDPNKEAPARSDVQFEKEFPRRGSRMQALSFTPTGKDGALLLRSTVREWALTDLDTEELPPLVGKRYVRASLLDPRDNRVIRQQTRVVEFLGKDPQVIAFTAPRFKGNHGKPVKVQARALLPNAFQASEVYIFVGKAKKDKPPEDVEAARQPEDRPGFWEEELTMPEDKARKSVEIGLFAKGRFKGSKEEKTVIASARVDLTPPVVEGAGGGGSRLATIKGSVVYDGLKQQGCKVLLFKIDEKANKAEEVASAATDDEGQFLFEKLEPGKYRVTTAKKEDARVKGKAEKALKAGDTWKPEIALQFTFKKD